jgi:hypothetical protein
VVRAGDLGGLRGVVAANIGARRCEQGKKRSLPLALWVWGRFPPPSRPNSYSADVATTPVGELMALGGDGQWSPLW